VRRDTTRVQGLAIYDTLYVPAALGRTTGYYGSVRGTLFGALTTDIQGINWGGEGPYRPQYEGRGDLSLQTEWLKRFPRHTFHILATGLLDYRTRVPFLTSTGTPQYSTNAIVLSTLLEIRILRGTITWQYRNTNGYQYTLVPGYIMPRQTNIYGVRWDFWN